MEPIVSSETSAIRTQTPGNYPKKNNLQQFYTLYILAMFLLDLRYFGIYAAQRGSFLANFLDNLSRPIFKGQAVCNKIQIYAALYPKKQCRAHLHHGGSLKSHNVAITWQCKISIYIALI